jgi:hypothetical protein
VSDCEKVQKENAWKINILNVNRTTVIKTIV